MSINELTQGRHRVVYAVGPRVLLLRLSLINVDVTTPDICRRRVVNLVPAILKRWADEVRGHRYAVREKIRPP